MMSGATIMGRVALLLAATAILGCLVNETASNS